MAKVISLRVPDDLLEWADGYAKTRGVSRTDLLVQGLRSFREDCEAGVPEIAPAAPLGPARASESPTNEWAKIMAARQAQLNRGAA